MKYYAVYKLTDRETNTYSKSHIAFVPDANGKHIELGANPYKDFDKLPEHRTF